MTFKKSVGPQKSGSEFGHIRPNRTCSQHWTLILFQLRPEYSLNSLLHILITSHSYPTLGIMKRDVREWFIRTHLNSTAPHQEMLSLHEFERRAQTFETVVPRSTATQNWTPNMKYEYDGRLYRKYFYMLYSHCCECYASLDFQGHWEYWKCLQKYQPRCMSKDQAMTQYHSRCGTTM